CLTGWGILAYLIAWAVIPEEDPARGRHLVPAAERTGRNSRIGLAVVAAVGVLHVIGAILGIVSTALIGLGLFPARIFGLSHRGFVPGEAFLGLVLLIGGLLWLFRRHLPWAPAADTGAGTGSWAGQWFPGPSPSGVAAPPGRSSVGPVAGPPVAASSPPAGARPRHRPCAAPSSGTGAPPSASPPWRCCSCRRPPPPPSPGWTGRRATGTPPR